LSPSYFHDEESIASFSNSLRLTLEALELDESVEDDEDDPPCVPLVHAASPMTVPADANARKPLLVQSICSPL
jgi:hypothetical protein